MGFDTRLNLEQAVANQFVTSEIVPFVPTAIDLATSDLNRRVRCREMISRSDAVINTQYTKLPGDYLEMKSFYLNTNPVQKLQFLSNEEMSLMRMQGFSASGKPNYFTIVGNTVQLLPSPDDSYTGELVYYAAIPSLTSSSSTNWMLTKYPDVYFYGTLLHAAPYIRGDERMATWSTLYEKSLEQLRISNEQSEFTGGVLKSRVRSY